jgi:virginiamycin B lyase
VAGPDGNLWFTDLGTNELRRMTPSGVVSGFGVGKGYRQLEGIVAGPGYSVWFAETHANSIARHSIRGGSAGRSARSSSPPGHLQ